MKCDIIKDLMPGYIDGLLSEAGSDAVREHLEDCEACKHVYMQMKEEIILQGEGRQGENIFVEQAALDGLRKVNSRTKRLRTVALLGGLLAAFSEYENFHVPFRDCFHLLVLDWQASSLS